MFLSGKRVSILIVLVAMCFFGSTALAGPKKTIGVIGLANRSEVKYLSGAVADMFVRELSNSPNFQIVEREKLKYVLTEQMIDATGAVNPKAAAEMGKMLGIKYLVYGSIVQANYSKKSTFIDTITVFRVTIQAQMIDTTTGGIVGAASAEGRSQRSVVKDDVWDGKKCINDPTYAGGPFLQAANDAVRQLVRSIEECNPVEGYIIDVSGKTVYIDLGEGSGIHVGQKLTIFREGEALKHPVTGEIMGTKKYSIGIVKIVRIEGRVSVGEIESESSKFIEVRVGDRVRNKEPEKTGGS